MDTSDRRRDKTLSSLATKRDSPCQASTVCLATQFIRLCVIALQAPEWLSPRHFLLPGLQRKGQAQVHYGCVTGDFFLPVSWLRHSYKTANIKKEENQSELLTLHISPTPNCVSDKNVNEWLSLAVKAAWTHLDQNPKHPRTSILSALPTGCYWTKLKWAEQEGVKRMCWGPWAQKKGRCGCQRPWASSMVCSKPGKQMRSMVKMWTKRHLSEVKRTPGSRIFTAWLP
jgi:hypothetical protein